MDVRNQFFFGRVTKHSSVATAGVTANNVPFFQTFNRFARNRIASTTSRVCSSTKLASHPGAIP